MANRHSQSHSILALLLPLFLTLATLFPQVGHAQIIIDVDVVHFRQAPDAASHPIVQAFPNPTSSGLHIQSEGDNPLRHVRVFDLSGRLMIDQPTNSGKLTLNLASLPPQTYILEIETAQHTERRKIIRQ